MGPLRAAFRRAIAESNGNAVEAFERVVQWLVMIKHDRQIVSGVLEELEAGDSEGLYSELLDGLAIDAFVRAEGDMIKADRIVVERLDPRENPTFFKTVSTDAFDRLGRALQRVFVEELTEWRRQNLGGQ